MSSAELSPIYSDLSHDADMRELIEGFVDDLHERIRALEAAVSSCDLTEVGRLAHQLKGSSGGHGFEVIGQAAAKLEDAARAAASVTRVGQEVAELTSLCRRAMAAPRS